MKMESEAGENIYACAQRAVVLANLNGVEVEFDFNGIKLFVSPASCAADIAMIYNLKSQLRRKEYGNN